MLNDGFSIADISINCDLSRTAAMDMSDCKLHSPGSVCKYKC